jgi:hypothetical protein
MAIQPRKKISASPPGLLIFHSIPKDFPSFPPCELERDWQRKDVECDEDITFLLVG